MSRLPIHFLATLSLLIGIGCGVMWWRSALAGDVVQFVISYRSGSRHMLRVFRLESGAYSLRFAWDNPWEDPEYIGGNQIELQHSSPMFVGSGGGRPFFNRRGYDLRASPDRCPECGKEI